MLRALARRISERMEIYRANADISLAEHIRASRRIRAQRIAGRQIVYLDTNAWKTIADVRQGKPKVTPDRVRFEEQVRRALETGRFLFPIGLATYFELDSMTDATTHDTLISFVDEMSGGYCVASFSEQIEDEITRLLRQDFSEYLGDHEFLRSPIELMGLPVVEPPEILKQLYDADTLAKASYDTFVEIPFSHQLKLSQQLSESRWDNSTITASLNQGKVDHQQQVPNFNTALVRELRGMVDFYCDAMRVPLEERIRWGMAISGVSHWHEHPTSRAFPTTRVLVTLHALMRIDQQRKFHDGDHTDFMQAASALPLASAFFTDRKLANLLVDSRLKALNSSHSCTVVSGFEAMAEHLRAMMA